MLIMIDSFATQTATSLYQLKQYLIQMVLSLKIAIGVHGSRFQIVIFGQWYQLYLQSWKLQYNDNYNVISVINGLSYRAFGACNLTLAMELAVGEFFTERSGSLAAERRPILMTLTASEVITTSTTQLLAARLQSFGVEIFSVNVGTGPGVAGLALITSQPAESHLFVASSFGTLSTVSSTLEVQLVAGEIIRTITASLSLDSVHHLLP